MKKTIIGLAIVTITFGGIYLFDNKDGINISLQPNNKLKNSEIEDEKTIQKMELKSNKVQETKKNIDDRISKLKNKKMGLDKKTSEPMFEVQNESVFDIELVEKKEFFDSKDNSFFVADNFKEYTNDAEINKIIDTPLKNYETDEVIKIKNYFIFDYLTPEDLALAIEAVHLKQVEYFEIYIIDHNEKSKYKKVKFSNCEPTQICRNDLRDVDISYVVSNGIGRGIMYKDSKATEIYVTKKGEILIYDERNENGNIIPEIQFYKEEG